MAIQISHSPSAPHAVPQGDQLLVERIQAGDEQAFYTLYRRYARYIAGVAYRIMGNDGDVDDIVQETFIKASQKIDTIKEPEHIKLWLVTIAVRLTYRRLKWKRRWVSIEFGDILGGAKHVEMEQVAELSLLRQVLGRMPEKVRTPWILRRIEGMTLEEVAEASGCSLATVKRRLSKAETTIRRATDAH